MTLGYAAVLLAVVRLGVNNKPEFELQIACNRLRLHPPRAGN